MPQLTPYFFVEQLLFVFIALFVLILLFSKIILPVYTSLQVVRTYITLIFKGL